ncbi:MAG TPA: TolC family protein [Pseudomonadales bacterium]|nr:TolC family protein [Pseudomonadales bacterium]
MKPVKTLALSASILALSACSIAPVQVTENQFKAAAQQDFVSIQQNMAPISGPITLEEAVARALKYNLDHRVSVMEQTLAGFQLEAGKFDMLPQLVAKAGYSWRDKESTRKSLNPNTGTISEVGFISSSKESNLNDLGLSWSVLDFGVSYYTAQQNADRVLIAMEQRRKTMHNLIQKVRTAYWQALAAEDLQMRVTRAIGDAEKALATSAIAADSLAQAPADALRYQRNLMENLNLLEDIQEELQSKRAELANLMGLMPGTSFTLAKRDFGDVSAPNISLQDLEEKALGNNPDIRKSYYSARIAALDTRSAILKLLPGIRLNYGYNYSDDDYLINQRWEEAGATVSFNLFNMFSQYWVMGAANTKQAMAESRRMAVQMAVLTQVHLANRQYHDAIRKFQRINGMFELDKALARQAQNEFDVRTGSKLDQIASEVRLILSTVRRYRGIAMIHEASSRLQATVGIEPEISSLDNLTLDELSAQLANNLETWSI